MAKQKIPSVLAFEKKLAVSDGYLYETTWENRTTDCQPITIINNRAVRGTKSSREETKITEANLQRVDAAFLHMDCDTLKLQYTVKVLPRPYIPAVCNDEEYQKRVIAMGEKYAKKYGFTELAKRYALNIANARTLWRNRVGAERIEVHVIAKDGNWTFNAYDYSLDNFDKDGDKKVNEVTAVIASALRGDTPYAILEVAIYAQIGKGQEVYPSQELLLDQDKKNKEEQEEKAEKRKGKEEAKKSKTLYQRDGIAAMHSQKLGNALRTIDTWYPADSDEDTHPIAVEPYGAVTTLAKAYRERKGKKDFYTLFGQAVQGNPLDSEDDEHFVMAVLVRGGVFGQSGKD